MSKSNACTLKTIQAIYNPLVELPEAEQAFYSERSIILKHAIVGDILDGRRKIFIMPTICTTDTITPDMEFIEIDDFGLHAWFKKTGTFCRYGKSVPYLQDEIVFVRESFCCLPIGPDGRENGKNNYYYRADGDLRPVRKRWQPPSHLPKEASRIWLRMNSSVQRLQSITKEDAIDACIIFSGKDKNITREMIAEAWDDQLDPKDVKNHNDWESNPWVWVIRFERINYHVDQEMITCRTAKIDRYREVFRKSVENLLKKDLNRINQILPGMQESERSKLASFVQKILTDKSAGHWRFVKLYDNRNDDMPCYGVLFLFTYNKIRCVYGWDAEKKSFEFFSVVQDDDVETERYISMDDISWLDNPKLKQDRPQKDWLDRKLKKSLYG